MVGFFLKRHVFLPLSDNYHFFNTYFVLAPCSVCLKICSHLDYFCFREACNGCYPSKGKLIIPEIVDTSVMHLFFIIMKK